MTHIAILRALLFPMVAYANGGPLLLIVNGWAFLYGSVIIVLAEWGMYYWFAKVPPKEAFIDALLINLFSTVVFGLAFPVFIAAAGSVGSMLPGISGHIFSAIGTWLYDTMKYPGLAFGFTLFWLIVMFLLTVRFEAAVLAKRWKARSASFSLSPSALSWRANSLTYGALFMFLFFAFGPDFF